MAEVILTIENVSKLYRLGEMGTGTLSQDLKRWWHKVRGKEDPFSKIAVTNDRTSKANKADFVWALQDVSFEVKKGEVMGIVGRNGAGKSTLLKILSRTTAPTKGIIRGKGKIASLLEVGTGFHPELTGRDNIFLNGSILGMSKNEIKKKFDEIVDFAGVERYIDTPVKRYSSGMYVRLAFGVAAHLDPEILIVDEVLAVGDAEFQRKALGKMKDVTNKDGRTVLFVSHNMSAVKELCTSAIFLENGCVSQIGTSQEIVRRYLMNPIAISPETDFLNDFKNRREGGKVRFTKIVINNGDAFINPEAEIRISIEAKILKPVSAIYFSLLVRSPETGDPVSDTGMLEIKNTGEVGESFSFSMVLAPNVLRTGMYPLYFWIGKKAELAEENYPYDVVDYVYYLNITSDRSFDELGYDSTNPGGYFNIPFKVLKPT